MEVGDWEIDDAVGYIHFVYHINELFINYILYIF